MTRGWRRRLGAGVLAGALGGIALSVGLTQGATASTTGPIDFEAPDYAAGDIDGQGGWSGQTGFDISDALDQEIVTNDGAPASFGTQSWRISNATSSGNFSDQPFSPSTTDEAGATEAENGGLSGGNRQTRFVSSFAFASTTAEPQPGLTIDVSPDRGDGGRMSLDRIIDPEVEMASAEGGADGLEVHFFDYQEALDPDCVQDDDHYGFVEQTIATGLSRTQAHRVSIVMDFVDGTANDLVKVYVDGDLAVVGTSWEDYYPDCEERATPTVDSLLVKPRFSGATEGNGLLLDNVLLHTGPTPTCGGEAVTVELARGDTPTAGDDVIRGTASADTINALGGADLVCSLGGNDEVALGRGADRAFGGNNADVIGGGPGVDEVNGENGNDELRGGASADDLTGGTGTDDLSGGLGNDDLAGGADRDHCSGGPGTDSASQCEVTSNIP